MLTLNCLNGSVDVIDGRRIKVYGKLLHVSFTNHKYYGTRHVHLWLSGMFADQDRAGSDDVIAEPAVSIIQVRYSSGETVKWNESTLSAGQLFFLQDLLFEKVRPAMLRADVFSKIQVVIPNSSLSDYNGSLRDIDEVWKRIMTVTISEEQYVRFKSLPVAELASLSDECAPDTLVKFEGLVVDVDQENAFCWFACSRCASEDISELNDSSRYRCMSCTLEFNSPVTNTHLELYLKSTTAPNLNVKVKLFQKTITHLLSGSDKGSQEGYDINCVLNKRLGPLYCYIVERSRDEHSKISFKLEELDSSIWIK